MRKLNDVLVRTGSEAFREIIPITLLSLAGSAVLVPVVLFAPLAFAFILIPLIYMPLVFGAFYAYHRRTEGNKFAMREMFRGRGAALHLRRFSGCSVRCWCSFCGPPGGITGDAKGY